MPPLVTLMEGAEGRVAAAEELVVLLEQLVSEAQAQKWTVSHATSAMFDVLMQQFAAKHVRGCGGTLDVTEVRWHCSLLAVCQNTSDKPALPLFSTKLT